MISFFGRNRPICTNVHFDLTKLAIPAKGNFSGGRPNYTTFSLNKPIIAMDATGQRFKIYVKEAFPPVYLIEYTQ